MNHDKYKELLELKILDGLSESEEIELQNHLLECKNCNEEFENLKKINSVIMKNKNISPTENDLQNVRKKLFNTINSKQINVESTKTSKNIFGRIFTKQYSIAFGGVALILIGLFVGYFLFNNFSPPPKLISENIIDLDKLERGDVKIVNVNLPEKFSKTGEFEFKLGVENPISYKGNLNDVIVQKLLANSLIETNNPGFKIRTANSIARETKENFNPDPQIKKALISSMKKDENPGVRKSAIKALINFPYDEDIRNALLFTLENDDNASNRMDAINVLLTMNYSSTVIDDTTKLKLEQKISNEENEVIKFKTEKLLIGGK